MSTCVLSDVIHVEYKKKDIDESGRQKIQGLSLRRKGSFSKMILLHVQKNLYKQKNSVKEESNNNKKPSKTTWNVISQDRENLSKKKKSNLHKINQRGHTWKWKFQPKNADHGIFEEKERCKFPKDICF